MIILGIETATPHGGLALLDDTKPIAVWSHWRGRGHSQHLTTTLQRMLEASNLTTASLGAIGVSIGPGSFTGIRVGLAVAKGMAYALGIPVVGVNTLDALAHRAGGGLAFAGLAASAWMVPVLDARRGAVYAAAYNVGAGFGPQLTARVAGFSAPVGEFADELRARIEAVESAAGSNASTAPIIACGPGGAQVRAALSATFGPRLRELPPHLSAPSAEEVAHLAALRIRAGGADDATSLAPIYLREPDIGGKVAGE